MSIACQHATQLLWFVTFVGIFGMIFSLYLMRAGKKSLGLMVLAVYMTGFAARSMIVHALVPSCAMVSSGAALHASAPP
jgi:hypothetical protein